MDNYYLVKKKISQNQYVYHGIGRGKSLNRRYDFKRISGKFSRNYLHEPHIHKAQSLPRTL